ncbi:cell wall-binding repeat-containing protein, partial [Microbacterium sp. BK668]|uniref:cell wall-binding repeat-containing protein n=1 Tax=Microbacterium sp. BK668 TaxID=2512118 RepID=UPI001AADBA0A
YTTGAVSRLSGPDRFATSAAISKASFDPGVPVTYVTFGRNFPDALSVAPVAGIQGGPILLTETDTIPDVIKAELTRLKPAKIIVLGSAASVSPAVQTALDAYMVAD